MKTTFFLCLAVLSLGMLACGRRPPEIPPEVQVKKAIEDYIAQDTQLRGAFFLRDPRDGSVLRLSFDHLHEHVSPAEGGTHSACVDFKDDSGKVYDVDVYVKQSGSTYQPAKLVLHKVNGEVVVQ